MVKTKFSKPYIKAHIWPFVAEIIIHVFIEIILMVLFPRVPHWIWLILTTIPVVVKWITKLIR